MTAQDRNGDWSLGDADAAAVDALFERGLDPGARPGGEREARVLALLSTLATTHDSAADSGDRATLIDVTLARLERESPDAREPVLTPMDEEAVEAWMLAGQDDGRVPAALRARAAKVQALGELVRSVPERGGRALLVERTLQRLNESRREPEVAGSVSGAVFGGGSGGLRWANVVSAAAVLCIATAVIWPVLAGVRGTTGRLACLGNTRDAGQGLARYASDHLDTVPAMASFDGGGVWWDVGVPGRSNSQNLFTLVREGYSDLKRLACGGNKHAAYERTQTTDEDWSSLHQVSYSYRVASRPTLVSLRSASDAVLLADRSPVVLRAVRGEWIYPLENSPNHGGEGQNVLRGDGSSAWLNRPVVSRAGVRDDNLWLPEPIERALHEARDALCGRAKPITGSELPASREDNLLGP